MKRNYFGLTIIVLLVLMASTSLAKFNILLDQAHNNGLESASTFYDVTFWLGDFINLQDSLGNRVDTADTFLNLDSLNAYDFFIVGALNDYYSDTEATIVQKYVYNGGILLITPFGEGRQSSKCNRLLESFEPSIGLGFDSSFYISK